jgi:hypothetical protein
MLIWIRVEEDRLMVMIFGDREEGMRTITDMFVFFS